MVWPITARSNTRPQTGNDYPAHEQTYENFITLVKVVMAIVVAIVVLMAYFLT